MSKTLEALVNVTKRMGTDQNWDFDPRLETIRNSFRRDLNKNEQQEYRAFLVEGGYTAILKACGKGWLAWNIGKLVDSFDER